MLPDSPEGAFVLIGVVLIVFGVILAVLAHTWHVHYEEGGFDPAHERPKKPEPWHREPSGEFLIRRPKHQLNGGPDEGTRRLMPTTATARSRVVMIGPEGIEDGQEAERAHRAGPEGCVRRAPGAGAHEEVGRPDSERGQHAREAVTDGEEGGADAQGAKAVERFFKNTVTGEIIFLDAQGRRVDFEA
jgi:hypothetical protein